MPARLAVPETMVDSVSALVASEGLPLTVVAGDDGDVQVVESTDRRQSTATVLQAGGWIACSTALRMAETLGVTAGGLGKLLDHIDIRVRACQLGCFE
jgi:hypothetical protein